MKTIKAMLGLSLALGMVSGCGQDIPILPSVDNDIGMTCSEFLTNTSLNLLSGEQGQYERSFGTTATVTTRILQSFDGDSLAEKILRSNNKSLGALIHEEARKYCSKNSSTDVARAYNYAVDKSIEILSANPSTSFCFSINDNSYDIDDVIEGLPQSSTKSFWQSDYAASNLLENYCKTRPHLSTKAALTFIYQENGSQYNDYVREQNRKAEQASRQAREEAERKRIAPELKRLNVNLYEVGIATCENFLKQYKYKEHLKDALLDTIRSTPLTGSEDKDAVLVDMKNTRPDTLIESTYQSCRSGNLKDAVHSLREIKMAPKRIVTELQIAQREKCLSPGRCDNGLMMSTSLHINDCSRSDKTYNLGIGCFRTVNETYDALKIYFEIRKLQEKLNIDIANLGSPIEAKGRDEITKYAPECAAKYPLPSHGIETTGFIYRACGDLATEGKNTELTKRKRTLQLAYENEVEALKIKMPMPVHE